jgi:transcriptional regulator with XRE-family HTH domain
MQEKFAARIKVARESLGLSQSEMAALGGVSLRAYQAYERAESWPSLEVMLGFSSKGLSVDWLLTEVGSMMRDESALGLIEPAAPVSGHSDSYPGLCTIRASDGMRDRLDLLPEILAPVLEWISDGIAAAGQEIDWKWAAEQVIGRYSWDFNTWLFTRRAEQSS